MALFLVAWGAADAIAGEHYYRDSLTPRTGPPERYVIEVPASAATHGDYFKVTTDNKNRVTRVVFQVDGRIASEYAYEYSGDAVLPHAVRTYTEGALTGIEKLTRDSAGQVTRADFYSAQGELTAYTTISWVSGHAESTSYTGEGAQKGGRSETYYSQEGVQVREIDYGEEGSNIYIETTYDTDRGLTKSEKRFRNGQLEITYVNTYDDDDDLVRKDLYNSAGTWYAAKLYEHDLLVKKLYKLSDGHSKEVHLKYDAKRWVVSGEFYFDNKLICTFLYEHLSDGTIKRTIAQGPDGSLWAEYPNKYVEEVDKSGHPLNSKIGIIHHAGDWF